MSRRRAPRRGRRPARAGARDIARPRRPPARRSSESEPSSPAAARPRSLEASASSSNGRKRRVSASAAMRRASPTTGPGAGRSRPRASASPTSWKRTKRKKPRTIPPLSPQARGEVNVGGSAPCRLRESAPSPPDGRYAFVEFSLLLPGNREKRLSRPLGETRNRWRFKDLSGIARAEGQDGTGRLISLLSPITGPPRNDRMRGPVRTPVHQELPNSPASG